MSINSPKLHGAPRITTRTAVFLAVLVCCALSFFCERNDVISGVGEDVVSDMLDSSLTNTAVGFVSVRLEYDKFRGFSIPDSADPAFSTHILPVCSSVPRERCPAGTTASQCNMSCVVAGLSEDNDTLAAHARFVVRPFSSFAGVAPPYSDSRFDFDIDSAVMIFRSLDLSAGASGIPVYLHKALDETSHVSRSDIIPDVFAADDSLGTTTDGTPGLVGTLETSGDFYSVTLPRELAKRIFDARVNTDSTFRDTVAFSIMDYAGELVRLGNPSIVINVRRLSELPDVIDDVHILDTIHASFLRFTAYEDEALARERAQEAYSSFYTKRTAVLYVDTDTLFVDAREQTCAHDNPGYCAIDSTNLKLGELLNAVLIINHVRDSSKNAERFRAFGSESLITEEFGDSLSLRVRFGPGTSPLSTPFNALSVKGTMFGLIRDYRTGMYIYLRTATENSTILWNTTGRPLRIETTFTRARNE